MDDLFGNIQLQAVEPILQEEGANKRKRGKDVEMQDEISISAKKKKRASSHEALQLEEFTSIIPRKMQCEIFLEFCQESVFSGINAAGVEELYKLTHKNFARCKPADPPESITSLAQLLPALLPSWEEDKSSLELNGAPLLLLISSSALRALELAREAKQSLGSDCILAKLFAKHMKIGKQQSFLSSRICHLATGTPERLLQLLPKHKHIASSLKLIVLDWQRRDLKKRRLIDIPETRNSLAMLLQEHLIPLVLATKVKFFLF